MKKVVIAGIAFVVLVMVVGAISVTTFLVHRSTVIHLQSKIESQYSTNKSSYDNMWKSFKESAQVTDMQAEDFKDTYEGMISGRYENDKNLLVKVVQEQNPSLNGAAYTELQQQVEDGRAKFHNNQEKISDMIGEYNADIQNYFVMNAICNFKKLDPNDYIVTSEKTENAFKTGKDDEIKLRDN